MQPGTKQGQLGTRQGQLGTKQGQPGSKQGQPGTKMGQRHNWTNAKKISRNLLGQKKIMQPLGTKKSCNGTIRS